MTQKDYMLSGDLGNWLFYATASLGMSESNATLLWHNYHNKGKYLICESRDDLSTRLFIRNVSNVMDDAYKKKGWWDTFTVTKTPTSRGLWLCKVIEYRLDRNEFLNLEVETILPVDNVKFHRLFSFESDDGTWNSIGWWLMIVRSNVFLDKYNFRRFDSHQPNYNILKETFPELEEMNPEEIGKEMLHRYLRNEITLEKLDDYLNTPTEWENFVVEIQKAVAYHTMEKTYGDLYPVLTSKIYSNVIKNGYTYRDTVEWYLTRQLHYYQDLVKENKIQPIDYETAWLDKIERALQYRKSIKDAEKLAKKEKRKQRQDEAK